MSITRIEAIKDIQAQIVIIENVMNKLTELSGSLDPVQDAGRLEILEFMITELIEVTLKKDTF